MISFPIPSTSDHEQTSYDDLQLDNQITYYDLMQMLGMKKWSKDTKCHLDPDMYRHVVTRLPGWKACFGPLSGAKSHLDNQCVKEDDLFLFFGWFRNTKQVEGRLEFIGCDIHVIFGYMQIGEIVSVDLNYKEPEWMKGHPHLLNIFRKKKNNTIYIAREQLSWNPELSGAGILKFGKSLVLTKQGFSHSKWELPDFFKPDFCKKVKISYHNDSNWKEDYFQSAYRGQEFVIQDHRKVENWAKNLIKENIRKGSDLDDQQIVNKEL